LVPLTTAADVTVWVVSAAPFRTATAEAVAVVAWETAAGTPAVASVPARVAARVAAGSIRAADTNPDATEAATVSAGTRAEVLTVAVIVGAAAAG
jgi:hypothetical protein